MSKFSGTDDLITSRFKSTWPIILYVEVLSYMAINEFGQTVQFVTSFA